MKFLVLFLVLLVTLSGAAVVYFLYAIYFYKPEAARIKALSNPCMAEPNLQMMLFGEKMTVSRNLVSAVLLDRKINRRSILDPHRECIEKNLDIFGLSFVQGIFKKQLVFYYGDKENYPYHPLTLLIRSAMLPNVPEVAKESPFWKGLNQEFSILDGKKIPPRDRKHFGSTKFIKSKSYTFPDGQPFIWSCSLSDRKKPRGNCVARYKPLHKNKFIIQYGFSIRDDRKESGAPGYYIPMKEWVTVDKAMRKYIASMFETN